MGTCIDLISALQALAGVRNDAVFNTLYIYIIPVQAVMGDESGWVASWEASWEATHCSTKSG